MKSNHTKIIICLIIATIAIVALCCITLLNVFDIAGDVGFDTADVGGSIVAIVGVYKYEPKGGGK